MQEYKIALCNRFKVLQELYDEDEGVNIDRHWSHIKESVNTTCEEVFGRKKPQQKDWISAETIRKIDQKIQEGGSTAAAQGQRPRKGTQQQMEK